MSRVIAAKLERTADTEFGVFGYLTLRAGDGKLLGRYRTAEEDWLDNAPNLSCIPDGRYQCRRTIYNRYQVETFEITGVPNRSRILFHWGNTEENVEGCVMLGLLYGSMPAKDEDDPKHPEVEKWCVKRSKDAFADFITALRGADTFWLDVTWAPPGSWRVAPK